MIGIYKITNPKGKIYIGQSVNLKKRFYTYKTPESFKSQVKLYNSVLKYGFINHLWEVVEECSIEFLNEREQYWQEYFNCIENGLNCKLSSTNSKSGYLSQEVKDKISKSLTGRKRGEYKTKKEKKPKRPKVIHPKGIGRKHSEETKEKMRLAKLGKPLSKEHVEKMRNTLKGRKPNNTKKVIDISNNIIYNDILEASKAIDISYSKLYNMLTNRTINKTNLKFYEDNI